MSANEHAVGAWGAEWTHKFQAMLERGWPLAEVAALHDDLDRIASAADGLHDDVLASAAIELSVYLCSFVEDGRTPDTNQRANLQRLSRALGGDQTLKVVQPAPTPKPSSLAHLLFISDDAGLVAELSMRMAERGVALTARSNADEVLQRQPEHGMHVVLVDQ